MSAPRFISCRLTLLAAVVAALLNAIASSVPAQASAEFTILYPEARNNPAELFFKPVCNARLDGVIWGKDPEDPKDQGDAMRLAPQVESFYAEAKPFDKPENSYGKPKDDYFALCLSSPGGDLREALKITKLFGRNWMMVVEDGADCISACSIIFMSAEPRDRKSGYDNEAAGRFLHYRGRLGFHAPVLNFPASRAAGLTPEQVSQEVQKAYGDALERMREVIFGPAPDTGKHVSKPSVAPDKRYDTLRRAMYFAVGADDRMPQGAILAFMIVPHNDVMFVDSVSAAISMNIEIYGIAPPPRLTGSLLASACTNVAAAQCMNSANGECAQHYKRTSVQGKASTDEGNGFRSNAMLHLFMNIKGDEVPRHHQGFQTLWPQSKPTVSNPNPYEPMGGKFYNRPLTARDPKLLIQVFEMQDINGRSDCDIRAIFDAQKLLDLQIQIVSGKAKEQRALLQLEMRDPQEELIRSYSVFHLRPWKMLPAATPLTQLGGANPWGALAEGSNFFSRPPNWK